MKCRFILLDQRSALMLMQADVDQSSYNIIKHRKQRHTDDHTDNPPETAEQQNGKQHPETGDSRGITQYLRTDDISIQLLQYNNKDQKIQAVDRAFQEQKQRTGNRADKRPEKRYEICNAYNDADQRR